MDTLKKQVHHVTCSTTLLYAIAGFLSLLLGLLSLTLPIYLQSICDIILVHSNLSLLFSISVVVGFLYLVYATLDFARRLTHSSIARKIDKTLSRVAFLAALNPAIQTNWSDKPTDPIEELDAVRKFWTCPGSAALFDLPWLPIYLALLFVFHLWLGSLATVCALLAVSLALIIQTPTQSSKAQKKPKDLAHVNAQHHAEIVRAHGMSKTLCDRWDNAKTQVYQQQIEADDQSSLLSTTTRTLRYVSETAVFGMGAVLVIRQEITPGTMVAASLIASRTLLPIEQAICNWHSLIAYRNACGRLNEICGRLEEQKPNLVLPTPQKSLEVHQVAITCPGTKHIALDGLDFTLNAGDGLGIVGRSGAGKTCLVRTLVGVWPNQNGSILLDGTDLQQWPEDQLGAAIGYLPQKVELLDGTVAQNISRFSKVRKDEEIFEAARIADAHAMITNLPEGYDTQVGYSGCLLSAGQRQRIGIARALYNSPFLIVLDEPATNLDTDGILALANTLRLMRKAGSIVIAVTRHPAVICATDTVLVLEAGRQIAFGPKDIVLPNFGDDTQSKHGFLAIVN
ncbi:type I secretion system permease/ATPase [Pseudovibrio denitrificans]|uniref:type I secretion system permease/ATPase n=1 Tax=Pseudovibrio denitrificans TaxID=258256 RepID=UPI0006D01D66|nr:type I secretion system permease/ATPase [Pseudovibrio denitrificans]